MFEVRIKKEVKKFIDKQPTIKECFYHWLEKLKQNPYKENDGILINRDYKGYPIYKKRFGKFRVLFIIKENTIIFIFKADSRGQVYK